MSADCAAAARVGVTAHPQAGAPAGHPDAGLLRLRQPIFSRRLGDDDVLSPALPDVIAHAFTDALPVMRLLSALPGGPPTLPA